MKKSETKKKDSLILRLVRSMADIKAGLSAGAAMSAASIVLSLIAPVLLGSFIDIINDYQTGKLNGAVLDTAGAIDIILKLAIIFLFIGILQCGKMILMNNVVSRYFTCAYRIKMSDKMIRLPVSYIDQTTNGDVISRMTEDVSVMGNTVHSIVDSVMSGVIQLIAIAAVMYYINWELATLVVVFVPISVFIAIKAAGKSEKYFFTMHDGMGKLYSHIEETYSGFSTMRAYNLETSLKQKYREMNTKIRDAEIKGSFYSNAVQPIIAFTNNITYVVICLLGGYLAITGTLKVGGVVAVVLYAKQFSAPLENIANSMGLLQRAKAASKRVYEMLDREEMKETESGAALNGAGGITFDNASFSYDPAKPLITGLNLDVKSGQKVAIVGPTGAGKTTIVNLLMRFYDIQDGRILIDGMDIMTVGRDRLRELFSMVLQDTWLFNGTIYENVGYGSGGSTHEEIEEACRRARADHFIRTLPDGYNTVINENSTNISGGQKQLLTIARAFLSDRSVLILDEATSNVDTRTEISIQMAMDELMKEKTSFVIAHRLSTIVNADTILVINEGSIVEQGRHQELLDKKGFYYDLYMSQYDLFRRS